MRATVAAISLAALCFTAPALAQECDPAEPITNEWCPSAIPLGTNPVELRVTGNTSLATNDWDIGHDNPCTGAQSRGADVAYSVTIDPGCVTSVFLSLCSDVFWYDQSLYLTTDCDAPLAQCRGRDRPCADGVCPDEYAEWDNDTGSPQTVYVILDGKYPSSGGAWILDLYTDCAVPVGQSTWGKIKASYQD